MIIKRDVVALIVLLMCVCVLPLIFFCTFRLRECKDNCTMQTLLKSVFCRTCRNTRSSHTRQATLCFQKQHEAENNAKAPRGMCTWSVVKDEYRVSYEVLTLNSVKINKKTTSCFSCLFFRDGKALIVSQFQPWYTSTHYAAVPHKRQSSKLHNQFCKLFHSASIVLERYCAC